MAGTQQATVLAVSGGASYTSAIFMGVPLTVALMVALGALIAVSNSERLSFTWGAIGAAVLTFALALALGLGGGMLVAWAAEQRWPGIPVHAVHGVAGLILAAYGQSRILPRLLGRLDRQIDGGAQ